MSTTDSFLPDPDRRIRDSDEGLAHEVAGDGPDYFPGTAADDDNAAAAESAAPPRANPLFRTPHAGEHLTAEQLGKDLEG